MDGSIVLRARWCHLANTIEFVLPSAHPSPQSKRQIDRFSSSCSAHGRMSLYTYNGFFFPTKLPIQWGSGLPSNTWFTGPTESSTQTASQSVQPLLLRRPHSVNILYNWTPLPSSKLPPSMGDLNPHLIMVSWANPSPQPKGHLNRFSRFCRTH